MLPYLKACWPKVRADGGVKAMARPTVALRVPGGPRRGATARCGTSRREWNCARRDRAPLLVMATSANPRN